MKPRRSIRRPWWRNRGSNAGEILSWDGPALHQLENRTQELMASGLTRAVASERAFREVRALRQSIGAPVSGPAAGRGGHRGNRSR